MRKTYIIFLCALLILSFSSIVFSAGDSPLSEGEMDFLQAGEHYVIFGEFEEDKRSMTLIEVEEIQDSWIRVNIVDSDNELLEEANRALEYEDGVIEGVWLNTNNIYMVLSDPDLDYWLSEDGVEDGL